PDAAKYGIGHVWFTDIESFGFCDGSVWTVSSGKNIRTNPVQEPQTAPSGADSGITGVLNGTYTYMCTFVTADGETEGRINSADVTVTNTKVNLTNIPTSSDSRVIARNIYRKPAASATDVQPLKFLVQIADNTTTTYVDNIDDASLGVLVNRINTTGGQIYSNDNLVFSADTTNLSIGWDSGYLGTAYACTAVGIHTMPDNYGHRNSAFGMYALFSNTTGFHNTAIGTHALNFNLIGNDCVAVGYTALMNNTVDQMTAVGSRALTANTTGTHNTAVGYQALTTNDTGLNNTAVGHSSMMAVTGGGYNTALGYNTLIAITTNNYNTAIGYQALKNVAAGSNNQNTALGYSAGELIVAGGAATGINNCTFLGANTRPLNNFDNNSIVIGKDAQGAGSNTVVLGHTTVTKTFLRGDINLDKTVTAAGTTGAQTINKPSGTVNFAASATSLVVTNSLVTANSIITTSLGTNDATAILGAVVAAAGSFTIYMSTAPTAETRVNFRITN
ncbi:MAG: hypothetical protein PHD39_10935, partial [Methylobacter tundripaludum]|nr:hypothetical protein [Methylobacter tundripaludum]